MKVDSRKRDHVVCELLRDDFVGFGEVHVLKQIAIDER